MPPNSDPEIYDGPRIKIPLASSIEPTVDICSGVNFTPKKPHCEGRAYFSDGNSCSNFTPLKKHVSFPENHPFADLNGTAFLKHSLLLMTPISPIDSKNNGLLSDIESEVLFSSNSQHGACFYENSKSDISYCEIYPFADDDATKFAESSSVQKLNALFGEETTDDAALGSFLYPHVLRDITETYLKNSKQEYVYIDDEPGPLPEALSNETQHGTMESARQFPSHHNRLPLHEDYLPVLPGRFSTAGRRGFR